MSRRAEFIAAARVVASRCPSKCVRLADLKKELGWAQEEFAAEVASASSDDLMVVYPEDFRPDITAADRDAEVVLGTTARHLAYLTGGAA